MKSSLYYVAAIISTFFLLIGGSAYAQTLDSEQAAFLTLINTYRAQNGAGPLQISVALQNSSQWMSNDMATKNYFAHTDSLGRDPFTRMAAFGYSYTPAGENLAAGNSTAQNSLTQWQTACDPDASGNCTYAHRQNMLNPSFKVIGIGRAYNASSTYGWYWTTDFGGVVDQVLNVSTPSAQSVSPNSGSGQTQRFSAAYTDPNGATDLNVVYLDFGTSPYSPNSCIVAYVKSTNLLYLTNDAANTVVPGTITPGGGGTLSNSQCTVSGAGGTATSSGNNLTVPFNITFTSGFTGSKNVYGFALTVGGVNGGWQQLGTWTPTATAPLAAVSVLPNSGTGQTQTFSAVYADPNGASDLNIMYLDFGSSPYAANSCIVAYVRSTNVFYLNTDNNGSVVSGTVTPGGSGTLSNTQCTISGAGGTVTSSGNNLTVPINVKFASGFIGTKTVYGFAISNSQANSGWQQLGSWTPATAPSLSAVSVTPNSGNAVAQTFKAVYTDPNGASDLYIMYLDFGTSPYSAGSCVVAYVKPTNVIYLMDDASSSTVPGTITPGGGGSLSNHQCTVSGTAGAVTTAGSNLTLPISVTFSSQFTGVKNIYGLAMNNAQASGGWQILGSWQP